MATTTTGMYRTSQVQDTRTDWQDRTTSFIERGFFTGIGAKRDGAFKKSKHVKGVKSSFISKSTKPTVNESKVDGEEHKPVIFPRFRGTTVEPLSEEQDDPFETIICKHCKKTILRETAKDHVAGCLRSKQEKARKKKEAREALQRAKERAERAEDDDDDDDDVKDGKRSKLDDSKGKKRKADDDDMRPNKKKKKDDLKPKASKPKGPVDVERQCGVPLPNGQLCARSLTCKSHSMGAKRAVPGRSLPYDMLLAAYQKKNQARQQKAAIDANAPALFDDELDGMAGPVDSDEERDSVMTAISRNIARPQPIYTRTLFPTRRKYQLIRMKEMLSNAMTGNRTGLFGVSGDGSRPTNDTFAVPMTPVTPLTAGPGPNQGVFKAPMKRETADVA